MRKPGVERLTPLPPAWSVCARGSGVASLLGLAAVVALLAGCGPGENPRAPQPPPPLTPAQQAAAIERGRAIAAETFGLLSTNLQNALASGGVSNALPFCSLAASPLTASVATRHGVGVRRVTHAPRNPSARASEVEETVLEGFRAALTSGQTPMPLATNLLPGRATFFAPIVINHALCLNCHGEPGNDISADNLAIIRRHYPRDEATGFKMGDLRGAWRIEIPLARLDAGAITER